MYQMIVFEILNIFEPHTRYLIMSCCLYILIILLLFIVPFAWFYFVISAANATSKAFRVIPLSILCLIIFLFAFFHSITTNNEQYSIEAATSRFGIYGVTLMATLSGFGAITCPYRWSRYFLNVVDDATIFNLEMRVTQCMERIIDIKKRMLLLNQRIKYHQAIEYEQSFFTKMIKFIPQIIKHNKTTVDKREIKELEHQLHGAEELHNYLC